MTLQERDYQSGQVIRSFSGGGTAGLWSIELSRDQQQVITGSDNGEIILWDYTSGRELWRAPRQPSYVPFMRLRPQGDAILSMTFPGVPTEWNIEQLPAADLINWIESNRYLRSFTCAERSRYQIEPLCPDTGGTS
jgi:WD40 repeat protein